MRPGESGELAARFDFAERTGRQEKSIAVLTKDTITPAAASRPFGVSAPCRPGSSRKASANLAREGRFDYLLVESTGISELLPSAEPRLGRRTVLTFPLLPPPQKN
jgi:hypothetical protein